MNKTFLNYLDSLKLSRLPLLSNLKTDFFYGRKDKVLYSTKDIYTGVQNFERVYLPAYTDADLNEVLPHKIIFRVKSTPKDIYDIAIRKTRNGKYVVEYENQIKDKPSLLQIQGDTEVEAKAKMILNLSNKRLLDAK